jgi:hypothetical protein
MFPKSMVQLVTVSFFHSDSSLHTAAHDKHIPEFTKYTVYKAGQTSRESWLPGRQ